MAALYTFIVRGGLFLVLAGGLLLALNAATDAGLRRTGQDDYVVWNDLFAGRASSAVVINGNSHAAVQIDPDVISPMLGKSAYNIGLEGQNLDLQLMRYEVYRRYNKKPDLLIQVLDFSSLEETTRLLNRRQYLPYLQEEVVYQNLHPLDITVWDRYLPLFKYRGQAPAVALGLGTLLGLRHDTSRRNRGFRATSEPWNAGIDSFINHEPAAWLSLRCSAVIAGKATRLLRANRQEGVRTILVVAPQYHLYSERFPNRVAYWNQVAAIAGRYGAPLINFEEDSICYDRRYFRNATHLNEAGAAHFSQMLADSILALQGQFPGFMPAGR